MTKDKDSKSEKTNGSVQQTSSGYKRGGYQRSGTANKVLQNGGEE